MSPLKMIHRLKNPVQDYAWGSNRFIQELMGEAVPSDQPGRNYGWAPTQRPLPSSW